MGWIDNIGRVGRTFNYTADGPVGLLENKKAIIVTATGGTPVGSPIDFATPYMKHIMGFVGITDVTIVAAEKGDEAAARSQMEKIFIPEPKESLIEEKTKIAFGGTTSVEDDIIEADC